MDFDFIFGAGYFTFTCYWQFSIQSFWLLFIFNFDLKLFFSSLRHAVSIHFTSYIPRSAFNDRNGLWIEFYFYSHSSMSTLVLFVSFHLISFYRNEIKNDKKPKLKPIRYQNQSETWIEKTHRCRQMVRWSFLRMGINERHIQFMVCSVHSAQHKN